jgi:hypothetical protein
MLFLENNMQVVEVTTLEFFITFLDLGPVFVLDFDEGLIEFGIVGLFLGIKKVINILFLD